MHKEGESPNDSQEPSDCDKSTNAHQILPDSGLGQALEISERIMSESSCGECDPDFVKVVDVIIKLAATTLEIKDRIENRVREGRLPSTEPFASMAEERHLESIKFLDQQFRMFAEFFAFLVKTYMSLIKKVISDQKRTPDGEAGQIEPDGDMHNDT